MKKTLFLFVGIISFLGINTVKADTYDFEFSLEEYSESGLTEEQLKTYLDEKLDIVLDYWEKNLKQDYPYYYVGINTVNIGSRVDLDFHYLNGIPVNSHRYYGQLESLVISNEGVLNISIYCSEDATTCYDEIIQRPSSFQGYFNPMFYYSQPYTEILFRHYLPFSYYISNFDYIFNESDTFNIVKDGEVIYILNNGDIIPTYKDLFINNITDNYITINLNDYPYVALTLKDYSKRDTFYTNVYVKGQYCLTPVYNYGMTEKKDIIEGSKNQRCSTYYNDYTLVRTYILDQDIQNNAIYYLKAYDTSKDNIVKVDSSMFGITYITEDMKDNPYVSISGKNYPTISYDKLTDTATKSEEEDYISGVSCQVGDFNCYNEYNPSNVFEDLFDKPLEMLKSVWGAIVSIFELISEFILLLPPTMQGFLYIAFGITIILAIIKILL